MGSDILGTSLGRVVDAGVRRVSLWGFVCKKSIT
jgi:hypothetical protein